jgi:cellulose synthase (UDP-forming)
MDLFSRTSSKKQTSQGPHLHGPTLTLIVGVAAIGALVYAHFIYNFNNAGNPFPYALVLIAEGIILIQALFSLWTILSGGFDPRDYYYYAAKGYLFGDFKRKTMDPKTKLVLRQKQASVDVFIPVYGESLETIKRTAVAAKNIIGLHRTILLDDGKSDKVRALADEIGVEYIRRHNNIGAKAGNINHALKLTGGEYFVILDADFVARPNFLLETLPFFAKTNVAFVQTPQAYNNMNNLISRGAGFMQNVFYKLIQPGKNRFNAAFCVGTNVVFRRSSIEAVGGISEASKSEDIWTSLALHEAGYSSIFINDVLAVGQAPETVSAYFKQQLRWATGGFEILLKYNFFKSKLSIDQKLQYFSTAFYYMNGVAILLLMLLPPLQIFFNLSPINLSVSFATWLTFYLGFYATQIIVAFYTMESFRLETIVLSMVSFPIYIKALFNVVLGRDVAWQATGDELATENPFNFVGSQILLFIFLLFTTAFGIWKVRYTGVFALSLVWNMINTLIFASFLYFVCKEQLARRSAIRRNRSKAKAPARNRLQEVTS